MKIATIVGARPQFVKASAVSRLLRRSHDEVLVHTGQHYDANMSDVFFAELAIPAPEYALGIGSGLPGAVIARMIEGIERVLVRERPERVVVYGDTNSTLAGALAGAKAGIPVAHVEAGLRSFDRTMPEELNRVLTDHVAELLLCPSEAAVRNLAAEGITRGVSVAGDVMHDAFADGVERARTTSSVLARLGLAEGGFLLATVHRAANTDEAGRLRGILDALGDLASAEVPVVLPVHPRTRAAIDRLEDGRLAPGVRMIDPVGYLDMIRLELAARLVLTDSGGVQKEAYWAGVPCVTMREDTEWMETVATGWNVLAGVQRERIVQAARGISPPAARPELYGDSRAAVRVVAAITESPERA